MFVQSQILRTLSRPSSLARLRQLSGDSSFKNRSDLVQAVCEAFQFRDARGVWQTANCRRALSKLSFRGHVTLPEVQRLPPRSGHVCTLPDPVPQPVGLPGHVTDVVGLSIDVVTDQAQRLVWNTLLAHEHPRGAKRFIGAQVHYLIASAHGYLGAVGFSAGCLRLAPRETWMGWHEDERQRHLHRVCGLSRLLIRGRCRNLASHVLGQVLRRVAADFEARYAYRPWVVETFVDPDRSGSCFKAANFTCIGQTSGQARRKGDAPNTPKAIFVYELDPAWRTEMRTHTVGTLPVRMPQAQLRDWVSLEFGGAPLGDRRLSKRLETTAAMLNDVLGHGIARHTDHEVAEVRGCYRLLSQGPESQVTCENILAPHRAQTLARMRSQKVVLCIQDGSTLNYDTKLACEGLQVIGSNQTTTKTHGLPLHVTLATTAYGLPLGVLRCSTDTPPPTAPLKPKMQKWLDGYEDMCQAAEDLPADTRVVCVMDREADCFALYDAQRQNGRVEMLVRAKHDRILVSDKCLIDKLSAAPLARKVDLELRRLTRRKKSPGRPHRTAHLEIRYDRVTMRSKIKGRPPLSMYGVYVNEPNPPEDEAPVNWCLLTSMEVNTAEEALTVLNYYVRRWRVEEFFRVLKSGCKVEELSLRTALGLSRAITIYSVIAWRVMLLTLLGRTGPDLPADVFFTDAEIRFLDRYARKMRQPPPETLAAATHLISLLGGYLNRSRDGPPGNQTMWLGLDRLTTSVFVMTLMEDDD